MLQTTSSAVNDKVSTWCMHRQRVQQFYDNNYYRTTISVVADLGRSWGWPHTPSQTTLTAGGSQNFRGAKIKNGVQNNAASERSREIVCLYPYLWHSGGTLVANEVNKNLQNKYVGARKQFRGSTPLPGWSAAIQNVLSATRGHLYQCKKTFRWLDTTRKPHNPHLVKNGLASPPQKHHPALGIWGLWLWRFWPYCLHDWPSLKDPKSQLNISHTSASGGNVLLQ